MPVKLKAQENNLGSMGFMWPPSPGEHENLIRQLHARIKELDCIYDICRIASNHFTPFDQIIQDITNRIPAAFREPDSTCACITIGSKATKTANFKTSPWKLNADIPANGMIPVQLEVGYLGFLLPHEDSPFLKEDKKLLDIIGARVGLLVDAKIQKESIEKSEKQFRTLADNALVGISQTNLRGGVLYANNTCLRLFGFDDNVEEAMSVNCCSMYRNPDDRKTMMEILQRTGNIVNFEAECLTKTGESIFVLFCATLESDVITTMMMDISEWKRAHDALIKSERRLTEAQRLAHLGSWEWDIMAGKIRWSSEFCRIFGIRPRERSSTYEAYLNFIHPDDRQAVEEAVNTSLSQPGKAFSVEHRVMRPDGKECFVHARGEVIFGKNNKPVRMIGTNQDITARKNSEKELRKAYDEIKGLKEKLEAENIYLRDEIEEKNGCGNIIGRSDAIKYVIYRAGVVARTRATILLTGETGTGKNILACYIHRQSDRGDKPFINVNCAGLPANLIESELFGREKGAFTGSTARQIGRFELANNGTIFLDEIGELPLELQTKLLKVIDEGEFERLGSPHTMKVNVRIIASTNRNLEVEMKNGRFRQDLFFRLNVFPISIPPLRQRKGDIPLLVTSFTRKFSRAYHKNIQRIPAETMKCFSKYPWPGNVRELINVIERAVIVSDGPELRLAEPIDSILAGPLPDRNTTESLDAGPTNNLAEIEKEHIQNTLCNTGWRIEGPHGAAHLLGMNPSTVRARMRKLGIKRPEVH